VDEVEKKLGQDPAIREQISTKMNSELDRVYLTNIPISPYNVSLSTFMTDDFITHNKGVEVRAEGVFYPTLTGYKRYTECRPLPKDIDFNNDSNDFQAMFGECTAISLINTAAESGNVYSRYININGVPTVVVIQLKQWYQTTVDFNTASLEVKTIAHLQAEVYGINLELDAYITAEVGLMKAAGLHYTGPSIKQMNKVYSPVVENAYLGTWNLNASVKSFYIINCPPIAGLICIAISAGVQALKFSHQFKIPQMRLADGIALSSLDLDIYEGHILAKGSVSMEY